VRRKEQDAEDAVMQKSQALAIEVSALTQGLINSFSKKRGECWLLASFSFILAP
jgi:hypothetical protein